MCWNADISLITFLFVCFSLVFIYITNTFTKYKTPLFDNPFAYLFVFSVGFMQLIEFFLWRNLNNKSLNVLLSKIASGVVILQILFLISLIPNTRVRDTLLFLFFLYLISYFYYKERYSPIEFYTSLGKNGHLAWKWYKFKGYENIWAIVSLLFYIIPLIFIQNIPLLLYTVTTMILSLYYYYKYDTFGTIWCWSSNLFLLYFIINILLIQPFYEYNGLC